jgi:hypothetical protein
MVAVSILAVDRGLGVESGLIVALVMALVDSVRGADEREVGAR